MRRKSKRERSEKEKEGIRAPGGAVARRKRRGNQLLYYLGEPGLYIQNESCTTTREGARRGRRKEKRIFGVT